MTYSAEDFERIAEAVGVPVTKVTEESVAFETAAREYRLNDNTPKRVPPSVWNPKLRSIHKNAERLLESLGIDDPADAADGPPSDLLAVLASHTKDNEEAIILRATDRVGKLVEILNALEEAAEAAKTLAQYSGLAIENVKMVHKPLTTPGNKGDVAVNKWIDAAATIYKRISGRPVSTSVGSPESKSAGKPGGPLIRFLKAAGAPLSLEYSEEAWRKRIRSIVKSDTSVD